MAQSAYCRKTLTPGSSESWDPGGEAGICPMPITAECFHPDRFI